MTKRGAAVGRQRRGHLFRVGLPSVRSYFPVAPEHPTHRAGSLLSRFGPHSVSGPGAPVGQDHFCRPAGPQHLLLSFACWDRPATAAASVVPEPAAPRARGSKQGNWSSHSYWLSLSTVQEERDLTSTSSDQGTGLGRLADCFCIGRACRRFGRSRHVRPNGRATRQSYRRLAADRRRVAPTAVACAVAWEWTGRSRARVVVRGLAVSTLRQNAPRLFPIRIWIRGDIAPQLAPFGVSRG